MIVVKIVPVRGNSDVIPRQWSDGAVGFDLVADIPEDQWILAPGETRKIPTGICIQIPPGYCAQIWGRSGNAANRSLDRLAGIIDPDFRGEINVITHNHGDTARSIQKGSRIAQLVFVEVPKVTFLQVEELTETERDTGAYGSTGS